MDNWNNNSIEPVRDTFLENPLLVLINIQSYVRLLLENNIHILNCEICTLLLDDILLEDIAKAKIMKKHLDVLHREMPLETKNCQPSG